MELKVTTLEGKEAGSVQLSDAIFGLEPRAEIIARCVQWQLNKRQAGEEVPEPPAKRAPQHDRQNQNEQRHRRRLRAKIPPARHP